MKVIKEVILLDAIVYYVDPCNYYDDGCRRIYRFIDEDKNIYMWRTSNALGIYYVNDRGEEEYQFVERGDKITLSGTLKEENEYNGVPQTVHTRCKVKNIIKSKAITEEKSLEIRRDLQLAKYEGIYEIRTVSYSEYKNNYNKCETLIDCFRRTGVGALIDIIIS